MTLPIKYLIFACLATTLNIVFQDISLRFYQGHFALYVSMLIGTVAGLLSKYLLDKKYIFRSPSHSISKTGIELIMYTFTGFFTTLLFWATELFFEYFYGTVQMRYFGALIGLGIGYFLKFKLDKRFVFHEGDKGRC